MKLLYIEWHDAASSHGWYSRGELDEWLAEDQLIIQQAGWLYKETDKEIVLLGRKKYTDGGKYEHESFAGNIQRIPKTWIRKRRVIKL